MVERHCTNSFRDSKDTLPSLTLLGLFPFDLSCDAISCYTELWLTQDMEANFASVIQKLGLFYHGCWDEVCLCVVGVGAQW